MLSPRSAPAWLCVVALQRPHENRTIWHSEPGRAHHPPTAHPGRTCPNPIRRNPFDKADIRVKPYQGDDFGDKDRSRSRSRDRSRGRSRSKSKSRSRSR